MSEYSSTKLHRYDKYDIDTISVYGDMVTAFDVGVWAIIDDSIEGLKEVGDFITELVHEIEKLQGENIQQVDTAGKLQKEIAQRDRVITNLHGEMRRMGVVG